MTVRAIVQSDSGQAVAIEAMPQGQTQKPRAATATPTMTAGDESVDRRCSPDPCQHTDRYRLVTPFSLRL